MSHVSNSSQGVDETLHKIQDLKSKLLRSVSHQIVGQSDVIELMLTSLFANGHSLFVGVPGLGKTLLVKTVAESLQLQFNRIQFTPDLMPSDITGTEILDVDRQSGRRDFRFVEGPVFSNLLLADEINRTPPKTQAALLQAMQERLVTSGGKTRKLPSPFLVFATQNPIEQEGTYPLPEAQLDRFMMMIEVGYPTADEEMKIVQLTTGADVAPTQPVLSSEDVQRVQELVRQIPVAENVIEYAINVVRRTRPEAHESPQSVKDYISFGAGPRASQNLILAGKAMALLNGRSSVEREDIRSLAVPVLRHRMVTNFRASSAGVDAKRLIREITESA